MLYSHDMNNGSMIGKIIVRAVNLVSFTCLHEVALCIGNRVEFDKDSTSRVALARSWKYFIVISEFGVKIRRARADGSDDITHHGY